MTLVIAGKAAPRGRPAPHLHPAGGRPKTSLAQLADLTTCRPSELEQAITDSQAGKAGKAVLAS